MIIIVYYRECWTYIYFWREDIVFCALELMINQIKISSELYSKEHVADYKLLSILFVINIWSRCLRTILASHSKSLNCFDGTLEMYQRFENIYLANKYPVVSLK